MTMPDGDLKRAPDYHRLDQLESRLGESESRLLQLQIDTLRKDSEDHERRLRSLEEVAIKFNFILYLTMGGGFVGLLNLATLVYLTVTATLSK